MYRTSVKPLGIEILNAVFTPMSADGSINYSHIPHLFEHSLQTGSQGVFLNGTTGECMSLSLQERQCVVEKWLAYRNETNRPDFKVFVHVGSCNLSEASQMAEHAQHHGADGIAMVPTFYFRPKNLKALVDQCEFIAAAAPDVPFYYYNIPSLTGVYFPMISFLEAAVKRIPNFAGLKNSFTDIVDYQNCLHYAKDNYALYWGTDEAFLTLYQMGNRHYVGSTYNYMSNFYRKILEAYHMGDSDAVHKLQGKADDIYKILHQYDGIVSGKEIMRYIGVDCGPVRQPLNQLTSNDSEALLEKLKQTLLFTYADVKNKAVSQP